MNFASMVKIPAAALALVSASAFAKTTKTSFHGTYKEENGKPVFAKIVTEENGEKNERVVKLDGGVHVFVNGKEVECKDAKAVDAIIESIVKEIKGKPFANCAACGQIKVGAKCDGKPCKKPGQKCEGKNKMDSAERRALRAELKELLAMLGEDEAEVNTAAKKAVEANGKALADVKARAAKAKARAEAAKSEAAKAAAKAKAEAARQKRQELAKKRDALKKRNAELRAELESIKKELDALNDK